MVARRVPDVLQGMNKVATARQLQLYVHDIAALSPQVKSRLARLAGNRLTEDGILIIRAKQYRTQD